MKSAILHIGTEKTGSTSIQRFLFLNRSVLARKGWLFPASAGYLSNHRLVVYAKREPEADLLGLSPSDERACSLDTLRERFLREHCREVLPFLAGFWPRQRTLIYSSEHLQSRLTTRAEISRVARLLRPMVDELRIIVYLRRQDRLAISAHVTSMRAGDTRAFDFDNVNTAGPYYDHLTLLENWSAVFGDEALQVRLFERDRLVLGDVVHDFAAATGIEAALPRPLYPDSENETLSWTAQEVLRAFNTMPVDDACLSGVDRAAFLPYLLTRLQTLSDDHGRVLPARASAEAFHARFRAANAEVAQRWLGGQGFDERFDDYPEVESAPPSVADAPERLRDLIASFRQERRRVA